MALSRREFIKRSGLAAASLGAAALAGCGQAENKPAPQPEKTPQKPPEKQPDAPKKNIRYGTVIGPGKYTDLDTEKVHNVLSIIDLDARVQKPTLINLDFYAHGVSPHPLHPTMAVLFEKHGKGCCEVDLVKAKVTRTIETDKDRQFYGHGAFSADGSVMYATEVVLSEKKKGVIIVRDAKTYEIKGEFPSYGTSPHDCHLIDGGQTLMITNGGDSFEVNNSPPCVTFVDIKTQKLIEKLEFQSARINAGHAAITSRREVAVVSAPRDGLAADATGAVSFRADKEPLATMTEPADVTSRMLVESLSVAIHEDSGVVGVTNPSGNILTFWNLRERKFIKSLEFNTVRGIALTLDKKYFAVSFVEEKGVAMQLIDARTLEAVPSAKLENSYLTGSHLIVYAL